MADKSKAPGGTTKPVGGVAPGYIKPVTFLVNRIAVLESYENNTSSGCTAFLWTWEQVGVKAGPQIHVMTTSHRLQTMLEQAALMQSQATWEQESADKTWYLLVYARLKTPKPACPTHYGWLPDTPVYELLEVRFEHIGLVIPGQMR
jgi:hypothetical protein